MKSEEFDVFKLFFLLKKRAVLLFIALVIISISVFSYLSFIKTENYKANFTAYSTTISTNVLIHNIASFQDLIESKDYISLAQTLDISLEEAESISYIEANELKNKEEKYMVSVMAMGKDSLVLSDLHQNLKTFFSKEHVFERSSKSVKENLLYSKQKIEKQLDSSQLSNKSDKVLVINNNIDLTALLSKKQDVELDLINFALFANVGSTTISKPEKSTVYNFIASFLVGLVLAVVLVWVLEFLKFINARLKYYEGLEKQS